ncbi:MAG: SDR family NAD(P)-dependent oxidoreductase [Steroidobacteraceae bacterium]
MGALNGKAIVITGAGRGIGEAHARLAAAEGARVVVNDIDEREAERVASLIRESGGEALARAADISAWDEAEALVQFCISSFGNLDGLVNNAALFHMALAQEEIESRVQRIFEVNVLGSAFCGYAALRHMLREGSGAIVNVTSGAHAGIRGMSAYGASKGAVASLTYNWALDVEGTGVRVNAVSPMAQTRMAEATGEFFRSHGQGEGHQITFPPENNSPIVIYLLSDLANGVNGQVVRVQGSAMNLMTHPAVLNPGVTCNNWTVYDVEKAFSSVLGRRQLPLGVRAYAVNVRPYRLPYSTGGSADPEKRPAVSRQQTTAPSRGPARRNKVARATSTKAKRNKKR